MRRVKWLLVWSIVGVLPMAADAQQDRAKRVQNDRSKFNQDDYWIYNDLDKGIANARATGKPLLVVFR